MLIFFSFLKINYYWVEKKLWDSFHIKKPAPGSNIGKGIFKSNIGENPDFALVNQCFQGKKQAKSPLRINFRK